MSLLTEIQAVLSPLAAGGSWYASNTTQPLAVGADGQVLPYIVWQRIVSVDNVSLSGPSGLQQTRIQIDIFAPRIMDAEAIRVAMDAALLVAGFPVIPESLQDFYDDAAKLFRVMREFSVWYDESTPTERLGISGAGNFLDPYAKAPFQLRGWNYGFWGQAQEQDFIFAKASGANFVRLPLRWWGLFQGTEFDNESRADGQPGNIDPAHLAVLDQLVAWASRHRLWFCLYVDSECGKNGTQDDDPGVEAYCDPQGAFPNGRNFWSDPSERAPFFALLAFLVDRYRNVPYFGMIEPMVEPNPTGYVDADIAQFYAEAYTAIRAVDAKLPILMGGRAYQSFKIATAYNADFVNVAYTADLFLYAGNPDPVADLTDRISQCLLMHTQLNVPVLIQQTGVRSSDDNDSFDFTNALLAGLNTAGLSWAWWEYRGHTADGYMPLYTLDGTTWLTKQDQLDAIVSHFTAT